MAFLLLPFFLGASSDKWVRLAEHEQIFARGLAADGVRFGPRFMDEVIAGNVFEFGCRARPSRLAVLDAARIREIQLYSEHHCNPWYDTWAELAWPCEGRTVPRWCKSGNEELLARHLKVDPYFETLTIALRSSDDALERYNLMAVIGDRLQDKFILDYPSKIVEGWLDTAASVFLEKARPPDALGIAWLLSISQFEETASLARLFDRYLERVPDATTEERRLLKEVMGALDGKGVTEKTRSLLADRFGPRDPVAAPPIPDRTSPSDIALLVKRVEAYYELLRDQKLTETWGLMVLYYREEHTQEAYIRTTRSAEERRKVLGWRVARIQVAGDTAKLFLDVRRNVQSASGPSKETVKEEESFWSFENGDWYKLIPWPEGWEYRKVVEVPVPVPQSAEPRSGSF